MTATVVVMKENDNALTPQVLISKERRNSKLKVDQINTFLESDPESQELTRRLIDEIVNDPVLQTDSSYYDLTQSQQREETIKKIARLASYMELDIKTIRKSFRDEDIIAVLQANDSHLEPVSNRDLYIFDKRLSLIGNMDPQLSTRLGVHLGLFGNCIKGNGTNEQIKYWLQERGAIFIKGIYGCFAMTELGHGSDVSSLQTTATYDPESDTFKINTPDLTATKWWIGGAAHSATHSTVYARLIVNKKDYGVKTFVVPLRDSSNLQLMPGVTIGDIGAKMGRHGIDNGWIQFRNVIIPREYMLSRFTKVVRDSNGTVTVKTEPQLDQISGYSALLSGRVNMVMDSFRFGSKFATIATRYAVGRQQFADKKGGQENQLIDYPLHQYRVLPQLAIPYLISPVAHKLMKTYYTTLNELYTLSTNKQKDGLRVVSEKLKNLFIDSASLKATNTWLVANLIDELRQACGGHGYSQYNAFGRGYDDWVVQCTWEGDNNILSLTSAKSILKKYVDSTLKGRFSIELDMDSFSYLHPKFILGTQSKTYFTELKENEDFYVIWAFTLVRMLESISKKLQKTKDMNSVSKTLILVSKFHAIHSMLKCYHDKLNSESDSYIVCQETRNALWDIFRLFSLYFIDKHSGEFLQYKILSPDQFSNSIQPMLLELLPVVRKNCIALTDSFMLPDAMINAPIGYYDGNIYHNYFNEVRKNNPFDSPIPGKPVYHKLLTDLLRRGYSFDVALCGSSNSDTLKKLAK